MYIFYIDESGKTTDPYISHVIYSGFAIHDTSYRYAISALRRLVFDVFSCDIKGIPEIHANLIYSGGKGWSAYSEENRRDFLKRVCVLITTIRNSYIIATATNKISQFHNDNGLHATFEDVITRFSRALYTNEHSVTKAKKKASGIIIVDGNNRKEDEALRSASNNIRRGNTTYFAPGHFLVQEDSLFVDSHNSIMMQIADCIAWGINRFYNRGDDTYINILKDAFYKDKNGVVHGITHKRNKEEHCECLACHRK